MMSKSLVRTLNYNENKVEKGEATCIHAANFLLNHDEMDFADKRERFENLNVLRMGSKSNTLHAFISFSQEEKLDHQLFIAIAAEYMARIGFGKQPYLLYEHLDTNHRHFHIVSSTIRRDGSVIDTKFIGKKKSDPARIAIEQKFGLIRDQRRVPKKLPEMGTPYPQRLQYGKMEMVSSITTILDSVLTQYKYTSLEELNALLYQYNLRADPGKPGSAMYENKGLIYKTLDEQGKPVGVPVKASAIYSMAGLAWLEKKFPGNKMSREADLSRMGLYIDLALRSHPQNLGELSRYLKSEQIQLLPYMNKQGRVYDLMVIDHRTRSVAAAGSLGKTYTADEILERMGLDPYLKPLSSNVKSHAGQINLANRQEKIYIPDRTHTSQDINKAMEIIRLQEEMERYPEEQIRQHRHR